MPERRTAEIEKYIEELHGRAKESQAEAKRTLNPLFEGDERRRPPGEFIDSSFLYIRSCDGDNGSRPVQCPAFWLSPDLRVAPLADLGTPTRDLTAGNTYRFTAIVRNRGDLFVPSAKVEFYLCNPTLGWDTRFATKLGVAASRVQAYGSSDISLDYAIPPALSGHRCLFARVFSFSPLDLPLTDFALDPVTDRHVAQLNLNIVAPGSALTLDWVHRRNAAERLELEPMLEPAMTPKRVEVVDALTLVTDRWWGEIRDGLSLEFEPGKGPAIDARRTDLGLELSSEDREAFSLDHQAELVSRVLKAMQALEAGRAHSAKYSDLLKEYRAMTEQTVRSRVTLALPDVGLEPGHAVGVNLIKRDHSSGQATGGVGLLIAGT